MISLGLKLDQVRFARLTMPLSYSASRIGSESSSSTLVVSAAESELSADSETLVRILSSATMRLHRPRGGRRRARRSELKDEGCRSVGGSSVMCSWDACRAADAGTKIKAGRGRRPSSELAQLRRLVSVDSVVSLLDSSCGSFVVLQVSGRSLYRPASPANR